MPSTTGNIAAVETEASSQLNWRLAVRRIASKPAEMTRYRLMLDSLDVMAELESRYANMIGDKPLTAILRGLSAFIAQTEKL